ncbi:MAG: hypothetical protein AAGF11_23680 [Myxococcota bacterium]
MPDDAESASPHLVSWRDSDKEFTGATGRRHMFRLRKLIVRWIELEDVLFHFDSAVMMADGIDGTTGQSKISGLSVLRGVYMHAADNPDQALLIAGHTDTSGPDGYNENLSKLRAQNVLAVLTGDRDGFVDIARQKHQVEDYQQILAWVARTEGWDCDPSAGTGTFSNKHDAATDKAVEEFQRRYSEADFGQKISVDGDVGKQTWGAVFDLYMRRLAILCETDEAGLADKRSAIHWLYDDRKFVGSGEYHPVDEPGKDGHRSPTNRRLELLFYEPSEHPREKPGEICHKGGKAAAKTCPIYNPDLYDFEYLVPKMLDILGVDPHFAPSKETLSIRYRVEGMSAEDVTLEIHSAHYPDGPIFTKKLAGGEKSDGTHTFAWDGKANCTKGSLKDRYIHPLLSPYEVRLHDGGKHADKASFRVLYHSLKIRQGPWTPDGKAPPKSNKKDWVQYRLNELGYYGGPVGKDFDDYLKKAIIRYKANHKSLHELDYTNYNDSITGALETALAAGDNKRNFLTGNAFTDPSAESQIRVEALTYEDGEFSASKAAKEGPRLSRPLIPVQVEIRLRGKGGGAVVAPEATGPVRIDWRFTDSNEDISVLPTNIAGEPSKTRKYVEKCLKLESGRTGSNGDNAPKTFGGIRVSAATNYETPFLLGDKLLPYEVKKDAGNKVVYSTAHDDPAKHPAARGTAGVYFRPSNIGGDDYKLRAEIDFQGLANKAALEAAHGIVDEATRIHVETGVFRIWRFSTVAVHVRWPARTNSNQWPQVKQEFAKAYLDLDVANITTYTISNVISTKEYKEIVADNTDHKKGKVKLLNDSLVGVKLPKQGSLTASKYKTALRQFTNANYWNKIYKDLRKKLSENIRKKHPTGFIVVDFMTHKPVNIKTAPPGNNTVTAAHTGYITWTFSIGLPDSVIFCDQKDPDKVYYVAAHEMGHNFWLKHWENAGGSRANDHDQDDHNCLMSYSSSSSAHAHHRPGTFTPHFCGQCNLKLRGWDIDNAALPADST